MYWKDIKDKLGILQTMRYTYEDMDDEKFDILMEMINQFIRVVEEQKLLED